MALAEVKELIIPTSGNVLITPLGDIGASVDPNQYDLSAEEMDLREAELVAELKRDVELDPAQDIVTVVIPWDSRFSDFARTSETLAYPGYDNHAAMLEYEQSSFFIFTVDTHMERIAHVKRIVMPQDEAMREQTGHTGVEIIDDRLKAEVADEHMALEDILAYHGIKDIETAWNVTSNHDTGRGLTGGMEEFIQKPYTLVSYKGLFQLGRESGVENLFAYLNPGAVRSLGRLGLTHDLVGGRPFHLPEPGEPGHYDEDFTAVVIPYTQENMALFTTVNPEILATALIGNRDVAIYEETEFGNSTGFARRQTV